MKKRFLKERILLTILFFMIFLVNYLSISLVFYPAYVSTQMACNENFETDYVATASFNRENQNITISYCDENSIEYKKALAHEMTHYYQFVEGKMYNCDNKIGVWLNEVSAYSSELFVIFK